MTRPCMTRIDSSSTDNCVLRFAGKVLKTSAQLCRFLPVNDLVLEVRDARNASLALLTLNLDGIKVEREVGFHESATAVAEAMVAQAETNLQER